MTKMGRRKRAPVPCLSFYAGTFATSSIETAMLLLGDGLILKAWLHSSIEC